MLQPHEGDFESDCKIAVDGINQPKDDVSEFGVLSKECIQALSASLNFR